MSDSNFTDRSLTGAQWLTPTVSADRINAIQRATGLSSIAARCLALRTAAPPKETEAALDTGWIRPSIEHLHDPLQMLGMEAAVDRLRSALRDRQRIRVVTDYDVDGTTSSLVLQAALRVVAADGPQPLIDYHIPDRFIEGYGFSVQAAEAAVRDGIDLIVTADIGVRDHAAIASARNAGTDVLVCDHHLPAGAAVPSDALVLCPPQAACSYPNPALAACGISVKLAQALLERHPKKEQLLRSFLKLAAIGTVADLVPLTTLENRAIVALGLEALNQGSHGPGLKALLDASGLGTDPIREYDLGFRIGPRINAAGRVADAKLVVELLNCRDPEQAALLAKRVDRLNSERKDIQKKLVDEAMAQLRSSETMDPFVVLAGPETKGWHRGVVGIVASRIKDEVHRPVAVVSIQGDRAVGSIRSIPTVHAVKALDFASDLLERYGGHPAAAGFTVPTHRLNDLRTRLSAYAILTLGDSAPTIQREYDAALRPDEVNDALWRDMERLSPFGQGNPRPRLLVQGVRASDIRVNAEKGLFKFRWPGVEAVWWRQQEHAQVFRQHTVDLIGELTENHWNGRRTLELRVTDARIAASSAHP